MRARIQTRLAACALAGALLAFALPGASDEGTEAVKQVEELNRIGTQWGSAPSRDPLDLHDGSLPEHRVTAIPEKAERVGREAGRAPGTPESVPGYDEAAASLDELVPQWSHEMEVMEEQLRRSERESAAARKGAVSAESRSKAEPPLEPGALQCLGTDPSGMTRCCNADMSYCISM